MACQIDPELYIRDISHKLIGYLESRHHTFVFQKAAEGIIFSYQFLKKIKSPIHGINEEHSSVFSPFYFGVFKNFTPGERNLVLDGILKEIFSNKKVILFIFNILQIE
jgi:hypothetical protein